MKFLLFSDLHCEEAAAHRLLALCEDADLLVGAGDFGQSRRGIDTCIRILQKVEKPAILVPGNSESAEELRAACRSWTTAHVLHGNGIRLAGYEFFGLGGGVPVTPFGAWSYDFTEEQATALLKECPPGGILVSDSPPKGVLDSSSSGRSIGSTAVRDAIERCKPRLVVCGHVHANGGKSAMVGSTAVVNAGPAGLLWELP
jgi:Icc-related predicted phosphoesterase